MTVARRGVWEPLPLIVYGYAVHPLSPSRRDTRLSNRTRFSTFTDASGEEHLVHRDVVSLEVGDEVYAFEKYTPKDKDVEGIWYRGYVVCTSRRPPVTWATSNDPSTSCVKPTGKVDETQQVFIGIFPASHIFVRDQLADAEGRLADVASAFHNGHASDRGNADKDDDEDRKSFKLNPPPDQAGSARARLPVYPPSLRSASPTESSHVQKPLPPRPSLRSGDDTAAGAEQPIIDEIASALREWHMLMFQYLARRDYNLFHTIREHLEALHLGRRQLLAQTLSAEETVNLRRQCVVRLVSGNMLQGLDLIVRHPTWGGLVTVDIAAADADAKSWMTAVRLYAMQASLANMNLAAPAPAQLPALPGSSLSLTPSPHAAATGATFPDLSRARSLSSRAVAPASSLAPSPSAAASPAPAHPAKAKFYHVFLDLRAFVASPCAPGETAELFFSLYNKADARFVSEEFCAVLNHHGVLARDPNARIRTLFTDLVQSDAQDPVYVVCRIVRNGGMKMSGTMGSIVEGPGGAGRTPSSDGGASVAGASGVTSSVGGASQVWGPEGFAFGDTTTATAATPGTQFRRPFGCAVLELTQLRKMAAEQTEVSSTREHAMPIYVPTHESTFSMLHQDILHRRAREYEKSPRASNLVVSVKVFYGDADTVVRENSSLLQDAPRSLRLGFPDVVFPGDERNELYVKLWSGDFSASQAYTARRSVANFARGQVGAGVSGNVQVSVEVRNDEGRTVDRVISACSGEPEVSLFHSMVFQRTSQPTFGELIKVTLPPGCTAGGMGPPQKWHLFFTFRQRSGRERSMSRGAQAQENNNNGNNPGAGAGAAAERPFAFAFLPLFPDGLAFLEDGSHTLALYKADRLAQLPPEVYLGGRACAPAEPAPGEMAKLAPGLKDTLVIRSSLCSTRFTQNSVLLSLLHWEEAAGRGERELLKTVLGKFTFVGEVEIVKFLRDIFDALFAILVSPLVNASGEMDRLVFGALVTVLGIVQDRRFSNFQPVLDVYIERHFNCPLAASHMVHSMNLLLRDPSAPDTASALRAALKVWHYVFKFIARSRELQKVREAGLGGGAATADHLEEKFKRELKAHLGEVNRMMGTTSPGSIIGTQTIALQHFTSVLPELAKVFATKELVTIVTTFANAVAGTKGKIVIWKVIMYLQVVKGFLFDQPESRVLLVHAVMAWIKPHFGRYDEYEHVSPGDSDAARDAARVGWLEGVRLCVTVVAVMLDKLQQALVDPAVLADRFALRQEQDNVEELLSLLPRLLDSYREFQNPASVRAMERAQSSSATPATTSVPFPESYPFALLSALPKNPAAPTAGPNNNDGSKTTTTTTYNPGLGESGMVLLVLILASPAQHFLNFLESSLEIEGRENFATLLSSLFKVSVSILSNEAFPSNWLNVTILAHKVLVKMMDSVATLLGREFVPTEQSAFGFDAGIWREAFFVLLKLLSSEHLVIEELSAQKRRAVWRLAGDIRGEGASILLRLWNALSWPLDQPDGHASARYVDYQVALTPLAGHVVNLCLTHHDQLRINAVHILYCMIVSEHHAAGHFDDIENELIGKLDTLFMSDSKGDDISRAFFISHLRHLFDASDVDAELRNRVTGFLDSVDLFLELLLSVRALPEGEEFADDRVIATLRLMNFIRRIGRDEIYIKYVHQLVNMHLQSQNYVEAALTLKLHADLHEWDLNSFAAPMEDLGLPQQSQFHRKETLYLLILDYLGKGKAWESAIEICKELAYQHAENSFNYARLAEILKHQAALLEHIVTDQRYYSDYFQVSFYGDFPIAIRSKQFIYRGYEWEKFGAFCERMLNKHPGAQLLKTIGDPPIDVKFGNEQYIQCTAVSPEPNRELSIFTNPDVLPQIRNYYEHNALNLFSYSRPMTKIGPDGAEEVWIEKTYLTTEEPFPTVLRRSQVMETAVVAISPVESALHEVQQRTRELTGLNQKYSAFARTGQAASTTPLSMTLNAAVDAPNNSGIPSFRQQFLSSDYVRRYPDRVEQVEALRAAIDEQVRMIDSCLKLHGQLCPQQMLTFHGQLEGFFRKNFQEEIQRLGTTYPDVGTPSRPQQPPTSTQYPPSLTDRPSVDRSIPESTSSGRQQFTITPLDVGHAHMPPPPPLTPRENGQFPPDGTLSAKQTIVQRDLAHLARHGFNGVALAPRDHAGSIAESSPRDSFVNGAGIPLVGLSGASITSSTVGSIGSLRGRFSKLSSLNFGRSRDG